MKRVWAALLILAFMGALSFAGHSCVHTVVNDAAASLETAKTLAQSGDFSAAQEELRRAEEQFGRGGHILELFLKREYVSNIRISLADFTHMRTKKAHPICTAKLIRPYSRCA